jgi:transposase
MRNVTIGGITRNVKEWCDFYGLSRSTFEMRIRRGWSVEDALTKPKQQGKPDDMPYCSEFGTWSHMWKRCIDKRVNSYPNYGGRGITVCERWRDFFVFVEDMGRKPEPYSQWSLDRIDNDGNYEPDNCRWATKEQQVNNRSNTIYVTIGGKKKTESQWARHFDVARSTIKRWVRDGLETADERQRAEIMEDINEKRILSVAIDGETKTTREWAEKFGIKYSVAWQRVRREGWDWERALKTPITTPADRNYKRDEITIDGETKGFREWCRHFGIANGTVWKRLKRGIPIEEALRAPVRKPHLRNAKESDDYSNEAGKLHS